MDSSGLPSRNLKGDLPRSAEDLPLPGQVLEGKPKCPTVDGDGDGGGSPHVAPSVIGWGQGGRHGAGDVRHDDEGCVWQGSGSSKNSSGSGFSDGASFLVELEPF